MQLNESWTIIMLWDNEEEYSEADFDIGLIQIRNFGVHLKEHGASYLLYRHLRMHLTVFEEVRHDDFNIIG